MGKDTARRVGSNAGKTSLRKSETRSTPSEENVIVFAGEHLQISKEFFDFLFRCYGEGLIDQFRDMEAWLHVHPERRLRRPRQFVVNWLNKSARMWAKEQARKMETERELRVGIGPSAFRCSVCHRRLLAAFLPATCPRCGAQKPLVPSE